MSTYKYDVYLDEVADTMSDIFEAVAYNGYDLNDFVTKYMKSKLKRMIDSREPVQTNYLMEEQLIELQKEFELKKVDDSYDFIMGNWMGDFYAKLQARTHIPSSKLIDIIPFNDLSIRFRVLQDYDIELALDRVIPKAIITCFHNPDEVNGYLSNWYLSNFEIDGIKFTSAEQGMMYYKAMLFKDTEIAKQICKTSDVAEIKALGRKVSNFNQTSWDKNKTDIMVKVLTAKFSQNEDLKSKLLNTHDRILVECAVKDRIWGAGISMKDPNRFDTNHWNGENLLGKSLMEVRESLRNN